MIHLTKAKKAFTMIELVFAIVVIGILASLAMPRIDRDLMQEAQTNILSDIRYTQHLALMDNKHEWNDAQWQRRFWHIAFTNHADDGQYYIIGSNDDKSGEDNANALVVRSETAIDPTNNLPMYGTKGNDGTVSSRIFIEKNYGITAVQSSDGCAGGTHIGFDYLGRPYHGKKFLNSNQPTNAGYISQNCKFTFTMSDDTNFTIIIQAETGFASISDQPDS